MTEFKIYDVVVVGGGVSGLIAARTVAEEGYKVCICESSSKCGGRGSTIERYGIAFELGAEWFSPSKHVGLRREIERYGIDFSPELEINAQTLFFRGGDQPECHNVGDFENNSDLQEILNRIDLDVETIAFNKGFDQKNCLDLDVPFEAYFDLIQTSGWIRDYLLCQAFTLMGAESVLVSSLAILRELSGFGSARAAFFGDLRRLLCGIGGLSQSILEDISSRLDVTTKYKCRVSKVKYDCSEFTGVVIESTSGERIRAKSVIICVPLNVIQQISFQPSIPDSITLASSQQINIGKCCKSWFFARSNTVIQNHTLGWPHCIETYVLNRTAIPFPYGTSSDESIEVALIACFSLDDNAVLADEPRSVHEENDNYICNKFKSEKLLNILRLHHPDVQIIGSPIFHDFCDDPSFHGTWLALKAGAAELHADASNASSLPMSDEYPITFAGSDLCNGWSGWVDGAITSGVEAGKRAIQFLSTR